MPLLSHEDRARDWVRQYIGVNEDTGEPDPRDVASLVAAFKAVAHEAREKAFTAALEAARTSLNGTHKKRHLNGYNAVLHSIVDAEKASP
jgi:hypothetical protein